MPVERWLLFAVTESAALLVESHTLFLVIKWAGAAYLVWLGVQALRGHGQSFEVKRAARPSATARLLVVRGVVTNLANPKALLFYVAILPQFIDPTAPTAPQFFLLGTTSICAGTAVFVLYATAAERMAARLRSPAFARYTNAGCCLLLIGAGAGLALAQE